MSNTTAPRRALLVIDVQNEYFTGQLPIEYPPVDISLPNITSAMQAARDGTIALLSYQPDKVEQQLGARGGVGFQATAQFAPDIRFPTHARLGGVGVANAAGRTGQAGIAAAGALA